ncbi:hypothetical protein PAXRUDRAFT_761421 [Paxillus rubicundulus Ve08.2h10]|uniref:Uncharacterized protein n=1 Tax=Paxillus rubicundulus Ve08.2h10 TaxID=930991 RepID=A0A0D0DII3_9AGAM|nr:hypothetical protein PAXRUDRAFT_761421 [Paxillus rubicundulus Ve08.2h10]
MHGPPEEGVPIHYDGTNHKTYSLVGAVTEPNSSQKVPLVQAVGLTHGSDVLHAQTANSGFDEVVEQQGSAGGTHLETMHEHMAESSDPSTRSSRVSCPEQRCQWVCPNGSVCDQYISCLGVPKHFKRFHGIVNIPKDAEIPCLWYGCFQGTVRRSNFVRHIREGRDSDSHLGHKRDGVDHYH